jgi:hypothetical protein
VTLGARADPHCHETARPIGAARWSTGTAEIGTLSAFLEVTIVTTKKAGTGKLPGNQTRNTSDVNESERRQPS